MNVKKVISLFLVAVFLGAFLSACGENNDSGTSISNTGSKGSSADPSSTELQVVGSFDQFEGRILFIEQRDHPDFRIAELDLGSGEISTLFKAPENSWIYQVAESSQGEVALSYSAPADSGAAILDRRGIFLLEGIGSENVVAEPLIPARGEDEVLAYPAWSPNGQVLYYAHIVPNPNLNGAFIMRLIRYIVSADDREQIVPMALLPAVSPDGEELTYITVNPLTTVRSLSKSDSFGGEPEPLILEFDFPDLDTPKFSPDGQWIYFIGLEDPNLRRGFLEDLIYGVPAYAHENHEVPADWYRLPATGGEPERLTELSLIIHDGGFSPDGQHFAFSTEDGLYVMDVEGESVQYLIKSPAIRDLDWAK